MVCTAQQQVYRVRLWVGVVLPGLPFPHTQDPGECFEWGGAGWIANSSTSITRERETPWMRQVVFSKGRDGEVSFPSLSRCGHWGGVKPSLTC